MGQKSDSVTLVVGGLGYIGSALVPLLAKTRPVRVFDSMMFGNFLEGMPNVEFVRGDVRNTSVLLQALADVRNVIWLAGIVTDELVDMNVKLGWEINVDALEHFAFMTRRKIKRLVYASSSSIYGSQDKVCNELTLPAPMTAYARQKLNGEFVIGGYPFETYIVRSATACGPAPRMRLDTIVNIFSKQAWYDGVITVHGGQQWRSNIHIMDAVDCYRLLLESPGILVNGQTFNIVTGSDKAIDIARMVEAEAAKVVGNVRIKIDHTRQDNRHYRLSAAKMTEHLGWIPKFSVPDAIQENFRWFRARGIDDPNDAVYYNTRRMEGFMKEPDVGERT